MNFFKKKKITYLMHKDIPVLKGEYSLDMHGFKTYEIIHPEHLPYGCKKNSTFSLERLNHWYHWRSIPRYRLGLQQLMARLKIHQPLDLVELDHALSVSDTYWIKDEDESVSYERINYFHRRFHCADFASAIFSQLSAHYQPSVYHTPNNTTCGFQKKAWFYDHEQLVLYKGGAPTYQQEPVNEWLASRIADRLGIRAIDYQTKMYEDNLISVCPCFTSQDIDLVSADNFMKQCYDSENPFSYNNYIDALKKYNIADPEKKLSDQMLIDYLIMNNDRHMQNMGVLVDANTNQVIDIAPVYDSGTALGCIVKDQEIASLDDSHHCSYFNKKTITFEDLLQYIDLKKYDLNALKQLPREYGNELVKYQPATRISDERIENLYTLLYKRILALKKIARNSAY